MEMAHLQSQTRQRSVERSPGGGWAAVFALTLCVSTLIASEFMPVSLLTPIAAGLQVSNDQAGQAIAVSGTALGGMLFDSWGYQATFLASAGLLASSALIAILASRASHTAADRAADPDATMAAL